jgi:hypothetical protein
MKPFGLFDKPPGAGEAALLLGFAQVTLAALVVLVGPELKLAPTCRDMSV